MLLVIDNGSVFTQNLVEFLKNIPISFKQVPSGEFDISKLDDFDSYILSGRRKNDSSMNALNSKIIKHAVSGGKPLLGICYGAEMLALTLGGTIKRMSSLHRGDEEVKILSPNPLCHGRIKVFESHHFEISKLNDSLENIGTSETCKNEFICVKNSKIFGTQFHPEMTEDGRKLIEKFVSL